LLKILLSNIPFPQQSNFLDWKFRMRWSMGEWHIVDGRESYVIE